MSSILKSKAAWISGAVVLALAIAIYWRTREDEEYQERQRVAAVAVAPIERRSIELRRVVSGALESHARFVIAPKVSGRVSEIPVDISDIIRRGDTVAVLDSAEFEQDVRQSEADLAVAEANLVEATSSLEIAERESQRVVTLRQRGIASESEFDTAQADLLSRQARVKVAEAQVTRAKSLLESARIQLSYTQIVANWNGGDDQRVIGERYVDEGENVSVNDPLLLVVELNPITAVIFVTERDYRLLKPGFTANFYTDAFPGQTFEGQVDRISPVFRESSRQARVELSLNNPNNLLKPGMFVRADIALSEVPNATLVPYSAITRRSGKQGVFLVDPGGETVTWSPVETGIRSGEWIQLLDDSISGRVVVLGQHLLDDGSKIVIPEGDPIELDS